MQTWEYLSMTARWGGEGGLLRPRSVDGNVLPDWEVGPRLEDYIRELGGQGWELISEWFDSNTATGTTWKYTWLWANEWEKMTIKDHTYEGMKGYFDYINQLGQDCWELVSAAPRSISVVDPDTHCYQQPVTRFGRWLLIFKRPTADHSCVTLGFKRPRQ
jgi:hypothetical protein